MAIELELRPTLLVGMGGTGARIADRIMKEVKANDALMGSAVHMLAFDTDEGDLALLKELPKENRIQFSQPEYVRNTLERNIDIQSKWCYALNAPEMTETIKGKTLIEGAGQIRMLTRLALHDMLKNGDMLATMENAISRLAVHGDQQSFRGSVQIIMIGSLGGATGSGSFIQLALTLRKAAENRGPQPMLRGMFLMPDIFIRSGRVSQDEWENLLSNGYASMKELNALTLRASLRDLASDFTFEYAPGEVAGTGQLPFEEVTFLDYENANGGSMGRNLEAYVDMAARAAYLNIFTPLGRKIASQSINRTLQQQKALAEGQLNIYSGIGVSAVEYPINSTKKYLSRRLVLENLKGDWTRLESSFRDQLERYKKDAAAGNTTADEPDKATSYLRNFAQLAKEDPPSPFFRRAYDRIFPVVADKEKSTKAEKPLHLAYVNALLDYAKRQFWDDGEMKRIRGRTPLDESAILESDSVVDSVRQEEFTLDQDFNALEANLAQRPVDILQNMLISADGAGPEEWGPHHLQAYVIRGGLHPVAVRAFLYLVEKELKARLADLNPRDAKRKLFLLANAYRSEEEMQASGAMPANRGTPGIIDAASKVDGGGGIAGLLFRRNKRAFAEDYVIYNTRSLTLIDAYANNTIEHKVLGKALNEVSSLIRAYEGLFGEIEAIAEELAGDLANEIAAYETSGEAFSGSTYVYANGLCKEDAWKRLSEASAGLTIDDDVNQQLSAAVFKQHRSDRRDRAKTAFSELRNLFHRSVVVGFGQKTVERDYSSIFDLSVIDAIRRQHAVEAAAAEAQGETLGLDQKQYTKRIVDRASRQALPYVSLRRPNADGTGVKFWAINPACKSAIQDTAEFLDLFQSENSGENAVVEPQFSPYALICANLRVNLQLQDFSKLAVASGPTNHTSGSTEGRMTAAYNARLERMLDPARAGREGAEFTPHVDKTWHLPGALPELHSALANQISMDKSKAYVASCALNLIRLEVDNRHSIARISTLGHGIRDGVDAVLAENHDAWAVYKGLTGNVGATRSALAVWDRKLHVPAADAKSHPAFTALTAPATLMDIFAPAQIRNDATKERDSAVHEMMLAWLGLLRDVIETQETSLSERARKAMALETKNQVQDAFFAHVREEQLSNEVMRTFDKIFEGASDAFFAE